MELMYELGILADFLKLPHQGVRQGFVYVNGEKIFGPDFSHLPTQAKFVAMMPQWDFLNFIAEKAAHYPCFDLRMPAKATELIIENDAVKGVVADTEDGRLEIRADLTVGADGRASTVRALAQLAVTDYGSPIDVLWFRLPKPNQSLPELTAYTAEGYFLVMIDRGDYYQNAFLVRKNGFNAIKTNGLDWFKDRICRLQPAFSETIGELTDWGQVKLLNVQVNRLQQWYLPGLLCIGDAAHAMSPVGGVGINLAIQDAAATANLLAEKLHEGICKTEDLAAVQKRREWPAKMTQRLQVEAHRRFFSSQEMGHPVAVARPLTLLFRLFAPLLRRVAARLARIFHNLSPKISRLLAGGCRRHVVHKTSGNDRYRRVNPPFQAQLPLTPLFNVPGTAPFWVIQGRAFGRPPGTRLDRGSCY